MIKVKNKAQEEIVGFVAIVVIVSIIALIFIAFNLRTTDNVPRESIAIKQLMESIFEMSTNCSLYGNNDYSRIGELLRACQEGKMCVNGGNTCNILNASLNDILTESLNVGRDRPIKGYELKSVYFINATEDAPSRILISFSKGNCSGDVRKEGFSTTKPASGRGIIRTTINICSDS